MTNSLKISLDNNSSSFMFTLINKWKVVALQTLNQKREDLQLRRIKTHLGPMCFLDRRDHTQEFLKDQEKFTFWTFIFRKVRLLYSLRWQTSFSKSLKVKLISRIKTQVMAWRMLIWTTIKIWEPLLQIALLEIILKLALFIAFWWKSSLWILKDSILGSLTDDLSIVKLFCNSKHSFYK